MPGPTRGIQTRTVEKCKICQSVHRAEIEDTIVLQRHGTPMANGIVPTLKWFAENSERMWGLKLNQANIHTHGKKHFQEGDPAELAEQAVDVATHLRQKMENGGFDQVSPDQYLQLLVNIGYERALHDPASITNADVIRAVAELTKRKHNDFQDTLMAELVGATGRALRGIAPPAQPELPESAPIEIPAEAVEVIRDAQAG